MNGKNGILELQKVSKNFSGLQALDEVSFVAGLGSVTSIIGPNGAGKTTLFNLITGHLRTDQGNILFKGEKIANSPPYEINRKGIARSFQIVNIFPSFTVFQNVQAAVISRLGKSSCPFGLAVNQGRDEVVEILRRVQLWDKAHLLASTLSYGDQRIMEVAIALASRPELLLLDEPTAGMAQEETHDMVNLIKRLSGEKALTILLVEHDMDVVFSVSDAIIVLHDGRLLAQGSPQEVRQNKRVQSVYLGEDLE